MATQAVVQLVVDESGAVPGLTRFQQRAMAAMQQPTAAAKALGAEVNAVGTAGTVAGDKMSAGFQKATGHALTNLDAVRLMRDDLGVHIPRAMEKLIASTEAFQAIASVAFGAFAFVGVVELVGTLGKRIYDAFSKGGEQARIAAQALVEFNTEIKHTNDSLDLQIAKLQDERAKLEGKPRDGIHLALLEDIDAADQLSDKLTQIFAKFETDSLKQMSGSAWTNWISGEGHTDYEQTMLSEHQRHMSEAQGTQGVRDESQSFAASLQVRLKQLQGWQSDPGKSPAISYKSEIDAVNLLIEQQKKEYEIIGKNTTATQEKAAVDKDEADKGRSANKDRQQAMELLTRLQREATEAGMQGDELANQKRLGQIDTVTAELKGLHEAEMIPAAVQAINDAYYAEQGQKIIDLQNKTALAIERSNVGSMKPGEGKIRAEHDYQISKINTDASLSPDEASAERLQAEKDMNDQLDALHKEQADKQAELDQRAAEQHARNAEQDLQYGQRAAQAERRVKQDGLTGWVSDYKAAVAEIDAQRTEQLAKLDADRQREQLTDQEYAQRKVDIERSADAEIAQQNQAMAKQLSQTLEQAYTDPIGFIKKKFQSMMFEILANSLEQSKMFQGIFGQTMTGGAGGGHAGGGVLSSLSSSFGVGPRPTFSGSPSVTGTGGDSGSGYSPSPSSTPYTGVASSGLSASSIGADIGSARGLYGTLSTARNTVGSPLASASSGAQGDPYQAVDAGDGNVTLSGDIPLEQQQTLPAGAVGSGAGAVDKAMPFVGAAMGAYESIGDTDAAFKSGSASGMLKGAMGDAMAGAAIGSVIPGIGMLVGAGIGAAVGLASGAIGMIMGEGGKLAARDYYEKTLFPALEKDRNNASGGDYQSAIADINKTASDGMTYMEQKWGRGSADWVENNYLRKEQVLALSEITTRARGGGYAVSMSASQFHDGGDITGFGDLATSTNEGFIHAMLGEAVVNPAANATHGPAVRAMNAGASQDDIAQMYGGGGGSGGGGDTHHHYNINALDPKSFDSFLRGGGARSIVKALNQQATRYAGDGISG